MYFKENYFLFTFLYMVNTQKYFNNFVTYITFLHLCEIFSMYYQMCYFYGFIYMFIFMILSLATIQRMFTNYEVINGFICVFKSSKSLHEFKKFTECVLLNVRHF